MHADRALKLNTRFLPYAAVFLLAIAVRAPFFAYPLVSDEGYYAYAAHWWFRGLTLYSPVLWIDRPQGILLIYKLGLLLFGPGGIRLWGALWAAGTGVFVVLIARRLFSPRAALLAGMLYAVFSAFPQIEGFTANAEVFALLPSTASVYCLLVDRRGWAGFFASLAFLIKPTLGTVLIFGLVWLIYRRSCREDFLHFLLSAAVIPLAAVLHAALTAGLPAYLFAIAGFQLSVNSQNASAISNFLTNSWNTAVVWIPLLATGLPGFRSARGRDRLFAGAWFLSALLGISMSGDWWLHYYIQAVPPLAVAAACSLDRLWRSRPDFLRLLTLSFLVFPVFSTVSYTIDPPSNGAWLLYQGPAYSVSVDAARYIQAHTGPDDTIYVAFADAGIYTLAGRRSSAGYLSYLMVRYIPGVYDQIVASIQHREPACVLVVDPPLAALDPSNRFAQALEENYFVETSFDGIPLYRRKAP